MDQILKYIFGFVVAFSIPVALGATVKDPATLKKIYILAALLLLAFVLYFKFSLIHYLFLYVMFVTLPISIGRKMRAASEKTGIGVKRLMHKDSEDQDNK